jgi:Ca2+-transporting ATPase
MPSESFRAWDRLSCDETLHRLTTSQSGLTQEEAQRRLESQGPNRLAQGRQRSALAVFASQFSDLMILVLLAAAVISGVVGEPQDTIAILVIVLLNGLIGAVQEFRAERALAALRKQAAPQAQVMRDGRIQTIDATELVPGDLVLVEAGNLVPADLRLIDAQALQADESALTGESLGVAKTTEALADETSTLGDRHNLLFKSSTVSRGRGRGLVIATGMDTEIGQIARLLETEQRVKTPLQQRMSRFGRYLALVVLAICSLIFVTGLLRGEPALLMFLTAVSLAVAAIPEALPAVVTLSLTFGARKLSRRQALVRKLPAVETLGAVTYICTDKTGTLTQNRMTVEHFMAGGELRDSLPAFAATEAGQEPAYEPDKQWQNDVWCALGQGLALNNDVTREGEQRQGEPTELALLAAAERYGFDKARLEAAMPRINEIPFTSERDPREHGWKRRYDFRSCLRSRIEDGCQQAGGDGGRDHRTVVARLAAQEGSLGIDDRRDPPRADHTRLAGAGKPAAGVATNRDRQLGITEWRQRYDARFADAGQQAQVEPEARVRQCAAQASERFLE